MGLKIYQDDGVIDEMTEFEAFKSVQSSKRKRSDDGEQMERHRMKRKD